MFASSPISPGRRYDGLDGRGRENEGCRFRERPLLRRWPLRERWLGEDDRPPNDERASLEGIVSVGWYSLPLYAKLIRAVDQAHGKANLALLSDLGRFEAETDLTTLYRFILRLANPAFVVEKTGELWRRYHDTGSWTMTRVNDTAVDGVLEGWGHVDEALCVEALAYMARCLELVGARNVVAEHPRCRARGDADCLFRGRWGAVIVRNSGLPPQPKGAEGQNPHFVASTEMLKNSESKRKPK
ncbi:MAG: 4-vinyl reductase [Polyangiaceae bacterium]